MDTRAREFGLAGLALACLFAVLLHRTLFLGESLVPADGVLQSPPWAADYGEHPPSNRLLADQYLDFQPRRHLYAGRLPLWNPHLSCGLPSLASIQLAVLYPVNLLLSPLGPFRAPAWSAFLRLLAAGAFTFLFLRRLGASAPAAWLSAASFSLCGFMVVWLGHPHVNAACLLPAGAYLLERGIQERSPRPWAGLAAVLGAVWLGGHPPTAVHICAFLLAYAGLRAPSGKRAGILLRLGLACAAGLALAAPQLLPYLEYRRLSSGALSDAAMARGGYSLSLKTLFHLAAPFISGSPATGFEGLRDSMALPLTQNFNERAAYVGIVPLALGIWAAFRRPVPAAAPFAAILAVCAAVVYGLPPLPAILGALPMASSMNHTRLLLVASFSLACLAGLGLDALPREARSGRLRWAAGVGLGALAFLDLAYEVFRPDLPAMPAEAKAFLLRQVPILLIGASLAAAAFLFPRARGLGLACAAWTAADMLWFAWGYNPSCPPELYYPRTPVLESLSREPGPFRLVAIGPALPPNTATIYGLDDLRGEDFIGLRRYEELLTGQAGELGFFQTAVAVPPLAEALNVRYALAPSDWSPLREDAARMRRIPAREAALYRVKRASDRALVVPSYEVLPKIEVLMRMRSGGFNPRSSVLLEEPPPEPAAGKEPGRVLRVAYSQDAVEIAARSPGPGFLLLLDSYYPGWKAEVDGAPVPVLRADYNFRAVPLKAGDSTVRFRFAPASFRIGVGLACMALAALAGVSRLA